jgi:predicted nucleic acid-binding protein
MINIIQAQDFKAQVNHKYYFDNNIWMYIFCPIGSYNQAFQTKSSKILSQIKSINATIYTSHLVLSEFANAYIRLEYNIWKKGIQDGNNDYKKHFKHTHIYKKTQIEIVASLKKISKLTQHCNVLIEAEIASVINNMSTIDFNDSYYIELCKKENLKLVSNDIDFRTINEDIDLIIL